MKLFRNFICDRDLYFIPTAAQKIPAELKLTVNDCRFCLNSELFCISYSEIPADNELPTVQAWHKGGGSLFLSAVCCRVIFI